MAGSASDGDKSSMLYRMTIAQMYQRLSDKVRVSQADWEIIQHYLSVRMVPAKSCLQTPGSAVKNHYFINQGLVRLFYITPEGKDINKGFYREDDIVGSLSGLILKEPSRFGIETIEPCTLVDIDLRDFGTLLEKCEGWSRIFNHSCQMMLIRNERREAELLTLSSKARFLQCLKNLGSDMERIPQYHIASYLGITPAALSRYKNQWLR